ncbi:hypothetical protein [Streptomyces roseolus]|uniref:hypothetical protein n=1 Tax=Streptomyces roseolus TaxID=67358 RepID=UPI00167B8418|nr:hypothetical protein [Streptomyces roseolus]GGR16642.1 hypothetical protein GCM10010282_06160 [Streptomyces roseolus]
MEEQGCGARRPGAALLALLLALAALVGCSTAAPPADPALREVRALLDRHAEALLDRDETAWLAAVAPSYRAEARTEFRRLAAVPLAGWSYRVTGVDRTGEGRLTARVERGHRVEGYDPGPLAADRIVDLAERDGRWYVTGERPAEGAPVRLWEQGEVTAVRGARSLVLGVGQDRKRLAEIARLADRAVPAVDAVWSPGWARRVLVLVPASLDDMGGLLAVDGSRYRGIAAVTTGETRRRADAPADRVIVNPEAYGVLGDFGRELILTHETVHVATRAHTSPATPVWLSEGFADWAAYRGSDRTPAQAAPELRRAVRAGNPPAALPEDADFGFDGDGEALAHSYESAWLACAMIADRWGEDRLTAFYREVGAHPGREGAVENALHEVLETTPERFTADWRAYLRAQLG